MYPLNIRQVAPLSSLSPPPLLKWTYLNLGSTSHFLFLHSHFRGRSVSSSYPQLAVHLPCDLYVSSIHLHLYFPLFLLQPLLSFQHETSWDSFLVCPPTPPSSICLNHFLTFPSLSDFFEKVAAPASSSLLPSPSVAPLCTEFYSNLSTDTGKEIGIFHSNGLCQVLAFWLPWLWTTLSFSKLLPPLCQGLILNLFQYFLHSLKIIISLKAHWVAPAQLSPLHQLPWHLTHFHDYNWLLSAGDTQVFIFKLCLGWVAAQTWPTWHPNFIIFLTNSPQPLWVEMCLPEKYVEALTSGTCECALN